MPHDQSDQASQELFRRPPDECFSTLDALADHCRQQQEASTDRWVLPQELRPVANGHLRLQLGRDEPLGLNHWSFSQLCGLGGVHVDTLNRLSPDTASRALRETLPARSKPLQVLATAKLIAHPTILSHAPYQRMGRSS